MDEGGDRENQPLGEGSELSVRERAKHEQEG